MLLGGQGGAALRERFSVSLISMLFLCVFSALRITTVTNLLEGFVQSSLFSTAASRCLIELVKAESIFTPKDESISIQ